VEKERFFFLPPPRWPAPSKQKAKKQPAPRQSAGPPNLLMARPPLAGPEHALGPGQADLPPSKKPDRRGWETGRNAKTGLEGDAKLAHRQRNTKPIHRLVAVGTLNPGPVVRPPPLGIIRLRGLDGHKVMLMCLVPCP